MGKRLIICEKPSVAADVARALGASKVSDSFYESDSDVVGFAVGHLVEQVDPEAYDARYKTWRFTDLPILPEAFRYEARDARAQKQLTLLHKAINREERRRDRQRLRRRARGRADLRYVYEPPAASR